VNGRLSQMSRIPERMKYRLNGYLATGRRRELYPDGYYQVRVMVSDAAGNFSQKIHTYLLANDPPSPPEHLYVQAGEWQLVVSWSPVLRLTSDTMFCIEKREERNLGEDSQQYNIKCIYRYNERSAERVLLCRFGSK